jgi:hypothetical protein
MCDFGNVSEFLDLLDVWAVRLVCRKQELLLLHGDKLAAVDFIFKNAKYIVHQDRMIFLMRASCQAATLGHMPTLREVHCLSPLGEDVFRVGAAHGHLDVVKYGASLLPTFKWNPIGRACVSATVCHRHVLDLALGRCENQTTFLQGVFKHAIIRSNIIALEWTRQAMLHVGYTPEHDIPGHVAIDKDLCWNGNLDILIFCIDHGLTVIHVAQVMNFVLEAGHVRLATFLRDERNIPIAPEHMKHAIRSGKTDMFDWVFQQLQVPPADMWRHVVNHCLREVDKSLDLIKHTMRRLRERHMRTTGFMEYWSSAIMYKCIPFLELCMAHGWELKSPHFDVAASLASPKILKWFHDHKCPAAETLLLSAVAADQLLNALWIVRHGYLAPSNAIVFAVKNNNIEMIRWLRKAHVPWTPRAATMAAVLQSHEILDWITRMGCPWEFRTYKNLRNYEGARPESIAHSVSKRRRVH